MNRNEITAASGVSVIVPAFQAARTIGDTIRTVLAEPTVAEIILVDDASTDDTAAVALSVAAGDPRLTVLRSTRNEGPAAARNTALGLARSPWIAVVDADDFVLPGRFARLMAIPGCEMAADNILFVSEETGPAQVRAVPEPRRAATFDIGLEGFVRANLPGRGGERSEQGFLKPLIRRDFLLRHGLRYDTGLRLGEDYDLYVRMLQCGARFRVTPAVGYVARWRTDSLSARHGTADLKALAEASRRHLDAPGMDTAVRAAISAQYRDTRRRFLLRQFLDLRAERGRVGAILSAFTAPSTLMPVARGVLGDKLAARRGASAPMRIGQLLIAD